MAITQATPLTMHQQISIDNIIHDILVDWPDLVYGEFEASDGEYQIVVTKKRQSLEVPGEAPMAVTMENRERVVAQSFDSLDGKFHIEFFTD